MTPKTVIPLVVAATVAAMPVSAFDTSDRTEILDAITSIAAGADRQDWVRVKDARAHTVTPDHTSLWGGDAVTQSAQAVISDWAGFLPGFDATHHMVTNHTIRTTGADKATAEADFIATHRIGAEMWGLGGRYVYRMQRQDDVWKVASLTMTALWETGDRALVVDAAQRTSGRN